MMTVEKWVKRKIQEALLCLAGDDPDLVIDLARVSKSSGVGVEEITSLYASVADIFYDIIATLDSDTLSIAEFTEEDTVEDKIFDLLMRQYEKLEPHKTALRNLSSRMDDRDFNGLYLHGSVVRSMGWILETAGADASGLEGEARKRALAWVFGKGFGTFLNEEDAGLPKTMMVLDRGLSKVALWQNRVKDATTLAKGAGAVFASLLDNLRNRPSKSSQKKEAETTSPDSAHKD